MGTGVAEGDAPGSSALGGDGLGSGVTDARAAKGGAAVGGQVNRWGAR